MKWVHPRKNRFLRKNGPNYDVWKEMLRNATRKERMKMTIANQEMNMIKEI